MTSKQTFSLNFFFSSEFRLSLQENLSSDFLSVAPHSVLLDLKYIQKGEKVIAWKLKSMNINQAVMSGALPCLGSLGPAQSLLASLATWL